MAPLPFAGKAERQIAERGAERDLASIGVTAQPRQVALEMIERPDDLGPLPVQPGLVDLLARPHAALVDMDQRAIGYAVRQRFKAFAAHALLGIPGIKTPAGLAVEMLHYGATVEDGVAVIEQQRRDFAQRIG